MRLEVIWQINNLNVLVAIASRTDMFFIGDLRNQELGRKSGEPNYDGQSVDRAIQPLSGSRMMIQSSVCNPWWNSASFKLSREERTTMDSSFPLWPAHRAQFVCKLWAAAICEDWNCPDPSDWNNKEKKYLLQFLAHEIWIFTSKATAPHPLATSETMQTGAATKIAESFEWRKDVIGTDS